MPGIRGVWGGSVWGSGQRGAVPQHWGRSSRARSSLGARTTCGARRRGGAPPAPSGSHARRAAPPPPGGADWLRRRLEPAPRGRLGAPRARASCAATAAATAAAAAGSTARLGLRAPPAPGPPACRPRRARQPRRGAPARPRAAATTPRAVLRVKNGAAKLPKPAAAAAAAAEAPGAGAGMERSQSRLSLSASFEALAIYFPCMNSFDDEDAGKRAARPRPPGGFPGAGARGPVPDPVRPQRWPLFPPHPQSQPRSGMRPQGLISHPRALRVSRVWGLPASRRPQVPRSSAFTPFPQVGPLGLLDLALPTHLRLLNAPILVPASDLPPSPSLLSVPPPQTPGLRPPHPPGSDAPPAIGGGAQPSCSIFVLAAS